MKDVISYDKLRVGANSLSKFSLFNFEIPLGTQNCSLKIAHKYDDYKYMLKHITLLFFVKENYITKVC